MKIRSVFTCFLLFIITNSSCIFNEDSNKTDDKGLYSLTVSPLEIITYPGGCGIVIISLEPDEDFEGDVELSFDANDHITISSKTSYLSLNNTVAEIVIFPDSLAAKVDTHVIIYYKHAGNTESSKVLINLSNSNDQSFDQEYIINYTGFDSNPPTMLFEWMETAHPEYDIIADNSWFRYVYDYSTIRYIYRFFNTSWDIKYTSKAYPPRNHWFLIRRREEAKPFMCVVKDEQGVFTEIPIEDFGIIK